MSHNVYRVMEAIGSSPTSREEAAKNAVTKAGIHHEDLRVAEAVEFDMKIDQKEIVAFRTKVKISYKYHEVVRRTARGGAARERGCAVGPGRA